MKRKLFTCQIEKIIIKSKRAIQRGQAICVLSQLAFIFLKLTIVTLKQEKYIQTQQ